MKDNASIYDIPPRLLPNPAKSLTVVLDYSDLGELSGDALEDQLLKDNALAMFGIHNKFAQDSIMEIEVYGLKDGQTIFYSRAHQLKLQLVRSYGIYANSAVQSEVLLHGDRYRRVADSITYAYDLNGLEQVAASNLNQELSVPTTIMPLSYFLSFTPMAFMFICIRVSSTRFRVVISKQ